MGKIDDILSKDRSLEDDVVLCTAISYLSHDHYFGRNLDLGYGYKETVTITPRRYPFRFRRMQTLSEHYAMIGMATVMDGYPLYYEATNEHGLSMAGLNFPHSARYLSEKIGWDNIASFELIGWVLGQCADTLQAQALLEKVRLIDIPFRGDLPPAPLHWMLCDARSSLVAEPAADGLKLYDDSAGVLTNEPPFPYHLYRLADHSHLSSAEAEDGAAYCVGMPAIGLPGDFSSPSRFVRAAFVKSNSVSSGPGAGDVRQFFHILSSVAMPRGSVRLAGGEYDITRYSCCCDTRRGIYYYTTYDNSQIIGVDMGREDLDCDALITYPLMDAPQITIQN